MLVALSAEREIVLRAVAIERKAAMDAVTVEREATLLALREMFDEGKTESRAVVDHAMYRLAQILGVGFVAALLFALVFATYIRRSATNR
jgi:uncharacterized membrane protein YukC